MIPKVLHLAALRAMYGSRATSPIDIVDVVADRMAASADRAIFIAEVDRAQLRHHAEALLARSPDPNSLPLWGMPFAVKNNIDVAGLPTTAACPAFAHMPQADAVAVARLKAAGAIVVGTTNLDQFATGLNGTRSPYGAPRCVFNADYISGGSSSGSAVAVAAGLVAFSLGTDTAGSGRVPAACNNIVGIKPTPGRISTTGLVPACRSLDCISVFAATVADGLEIRRIAEGFDPSDPYSRGDALGTQRPRRIGVLREADRQFCGDADAGRLYDAAIARLRDLGCETQPFDYAPFRQTAELLYGGPWAAERLAAIESFLATNRDDMDPCVRSIVEAAKPLSAVDAFRGRYRLEALRRETEATWSGIDALLLPTAPTIYTVEAMRADPIRLNSNLGLYTNFANLLGLAAIAVPAGFGARGLPFGVTLVGPSGSDDALGALADALHRAAGCGTGLDVAASLPDWLPPPHVDARTSLVVVGAHLSGMPLNEELTRLGATFEAATTTASGYRLFALAGTNPLKPGLVRDPDVAGPGIEVEIWTLDPLSFARFVAAVPEPLSIGAVTLASGKTAPGFLCLPHGLVGARDITSFGGWRAFTASMDRNSAAE